MVLIVGRQPNVGHQRRARTAASDKPCMAENADCASAACLCSVRPLYQAKLTRFLVPREFSCCFRAVAAKAFHVYTATRGRDEIAFHILLSRHPICLVPRAFRYDCCEHDETVAIWIRSRGINDYSYQEILGSAASIAPSTPPR